MITLIYNPKQIATPFDIYPARGSGLSRLRIIEDCHILIENDRIKSFIKKNESLPPVIDSFINCTGKTVIPGLIDSHTHLVWGGYREDEFEMRATGVPYEQIARSGGGIANTVRKTRKASFEDLLKDSAKRMERVIRNGTTSIEIKSGYGLSFEDEVKMLNVIKQLKKHFPATIRATFLGAHDIPVEYRKDREGYIRKIMDEMLPYVQENELADFVDVFCDTIAFSYDETERIIRRAAELGLKIRLHADEIDNTMGAELAVRYGAKSADHLIKISDSGIKAVSGSDTAAALLPGTSFYLKKPFAPARKLIEENCIVTISTDLNPGSSVLERMPMAMFLGVWGYGMNINEVYNAATVNAAYSLDISPERGCIDEGKKADLLILDCDNYKHLIYNYSANLVEKVMINGVLF